MSLVNKKDIRSFFLITLPTILVMLIIVEIILTWVAPVADPFERYKNPDQTQSNYIESQFKPNSKFTFEIEQRLPDMDSVVIFTTNNMGFRGDSIILPKPQEEYRIFIVGGSTTENLFIDDSWGLERKVQEALQDSLKSKIVKVYNAGKSGDGSPDHLAMLAHRLTHLQPDLVVLFPGINDLNRLFGGYDYLHFPNRIASEKTSILKSLKFFLSNFQLFRRLINVLNQEKPDARTSIFLKTNYADKVKEVMALPLVEELPDADFGMFRRNILSFAGILKAQGTDMLLLTQTHTWGDISDEFLKSNHWMVGVGDVRYPESKLAVALGQINGILLSIAEEQKIPVLDLEKEIPKTSDYFYDDCHFNKGGISKSAELISASIVLNFKTD
ncbi:GDSL-like Lipase/Acylhydrolase family protein [Algoriphagus alkaliphilus]|uniref:GDSL-like Lipase/Acylhydrolase family protein n=1 Tax=Algoriphagus alkaliphilus TaxID=279824 RepID=A0A1G5Y6L0_9BACT|nr:SGNH/GDSL hydrolase family protein [Algoriphagus alkaliphilus]SDA77717.1 GDSL-like Lipase/Acylhydrolase family protein [Algoriphagus alkaliphilus]